MKNRLDKYFDDSEKSHPELRGLCHRLLEAVLQAVQEESPVDCDVTFSVDVDDGKPQAINVTVKLLGEVCWDESC